MKRLTFCSHIWINRRFIDNNPREIRELKIYKSNELALESGVLLELSDVDGEGKNYCNEKNKIKISICQLPRSIKNWSFMKFFSSSPSFWQYNCNGQKKEFLIHQILISYSQQIYLVLQLFHQ